MIFSLLLRCLIDWLFVYIHSIFLLSFFILYFSQGGVRSIWRYASELIDLDRRSPAFMRYLADTATLYNIVCGQVGTAWRFAYLVSSVNMSSAFAWKFS